MPWRTSQSRGSAPLFTFGRLSAEVIAAPPGVLLRVLKSDTGLACSTMLGVRSGRWVGLGSVSGLDSNWLERTRRKKTRSTRLRVERGAEFHLPIYVAEDVGYKLAASHHSQALRSSWLQLHAPAQRVQSSNPQRHHKSPRNKNHRSILSSQKASPPKRASYSCGILVTRISGDFCFAQTKGYINSQKSVHRRPTLGVCCLHLQA